MVDSEPAIVRNVEGGPLLPTLMTIVPVPLWKLSCLKPYDAEPPAAVLQPSPVVVAQTSRATARICTRRLSIWVLLLLRVVKYVAISALVLPLKVVPPPVVNTFAYVTLM